ncbi:MAG: O-antigen ligase family protein [Clostridiales Family XIII bacterium]|jgi:hypothetical protein|nr:O-antigen ligase family protein [Clostridiales Family XIII bacterium]
MKRKNKDKNPNAQAAGSGKGAKAAKGASKGAGKTGAGKQGKADGKGPWDRGKAKPAAQDGGGPADGPKNDKARPARRSGGGASQRPPQAAGKDELKKDYIFSMKHAPRLDENTPTHWIQFIPVVMFSALVILLVRQYSYMRDMSMYYWSSETAPPTQNNLTDFFSHYKTELIGWSLLLMGVMLAYRLTVQQLAVKRSPLYWPMLGYILFVLLSFILSDNKDVAWSGWNDRFEGTAMILCYYAAVFFIMNSVNSERNIKFVVYPIAAASVALSVIGLSQATGHDFFQSTFGQKLIVPNEMTRDGAMTWDLIDQAAASGKKYLNFTFENNEIYQTVYNINYVSFYLTLLIPLYAMMFIWVKGVVRKAVWGAILGLVVFNFFGAASSGGMLGMAVVVVLVVVALRKKLIVWWRPVLIIVAIVLAVGAADVALVNHNNKGVKWTDELTNTLKSSVASQPSPEAESAKAPGWPEGAQDVEVSAGAGAGTGADASGSAAGAEADTGAAAGAEGAAEDVVADTSVAAATGPLSHLDYFSTEANKLTFSVDGNEAVMAVTPEGDVSVADDTGAQLALTQGEGSPEVGISDERFANIFLQASQDEDGNKYVVFNIRGDSERTWPFMLTGEGSSTLEYRNDLGKAVSLVNVPHIGFADNPGFGSGRGYIWSASLPMIKDTIFVGHGADTYCIYYPHKDYVGKYNAGWNINMIVDKPHNMYMATAINTGVISLIAMFILFGMYMVQSLRLYWRREFTTFAEYAGAGIFFGISGFVISGFVDDSTVSVMPMFYGLLATGIAINIMLKKRYRVENEAAGNVSEGEGKPSKEATKTV